MRGEERKGNGWWRGQLEVGRCLIPNKPKYAGRWWV